MDRKFAALCLGCVIIGLFLSAPKERTSAQTSGGERFMPSIPRTWDDQAMADLEVPLADPGASPKHVSAEYYYKIPVRVMYKTYPVYAPGREPPGYLEWLKQQEPVILWDDKGHVPKLEAEADWLKAGEMVFDAPILTGGLFDGFPQDTLYVREPGFYQKTGMPVAADGTVPFYRYVIKTKGQVKIGVLGCAMCHTRVMPNGTVLKGAQGNLPFDRAMAYNYRTGGGPPEVARGLEHALFAAPWIRPDTQPHLDQMSIEEIAKRHDPIPPGVIARHRTSTLTPVQVPDLIGVKDRRYLDRTGLQQLGSMVDLMRYAALNQGGDDMASFGGFIPDGSPLPEPGKVGERYSDTQLYALALYVYSLQPPPNPNKPDALSKRGEEIFRRENCRVCHTPPLYSSNKLTIAEGFTPPPDADEKYDILPVSVGTDAGLTLKTRRGTGYYKVPSLKGVWYRSMFGHSGWCATLEDWFDPRRLRDDYVPTGFMPYGAKTYAVKGHRFGLKLSDDDRKALIAFLKTL
jgi:hypothetical protein